MSKFKFKKAERLPTKAQIEWLILHGWKKEVEGFPKTYEEAREAIDNTIIKEEIYWYEAGSW